MNDYTVTQTQVNAWDFQSKIRAVKTDQKDNLVVVDKVYGNVSIYTSDTALPSELKTGLAANQVIFEDLGADDVQATPEEIGHFTGQVTMAATPYDPSGHISHLNDQIRTFKTHLNDDIGILNVRDHIDQQLEQLQQALDKKDPKDIEQKSDHLLNSSKQLFFGQFYLPDYQVFHLPQPQYKLGAELGEIAQFAKMIGKHLHVAQ